MINCSTIQHANHHLKQKYDTLMSMKASPFQESASACFSVLDSYRRFLRYIYFYWKESLKKVENFELACVTQSQNEIFDKTRRKQIVYWHDTCLEIDGKKFSGTFIPFRDISEDKES